MTSLPRVVFLTDIVTPYTVAVLSALAERVHLVALFCAQTGTRGAEWVFDKPFPFRHRVLGGFAIRRRTPDAADLYPTPRIFRALTQERPAAMISGAFSFPSAYAAAYGRLSGARLVIHSDGTSFSERHLSRTQRLARGVLLRQATVCVGNSAPAAARFVELGAARDRVFCAPHSTNVAPLHAVARERFDARPSDGRLTVLHVGRLIPRKGVDRLLRAVAVARRDASLRLVLAGSGPEEARLRRLAEALDIEADVEFRGFIDQPALPAAYAEADVFAFPTLDDPFGIVVLEAAASGLPIIGSPFGGAISDLVEDGDSGFVLDPDDTAAWAHALVVLAHDAELRRRLGKRAHAATLARTPENTANGYAAAVQAALRLRGPATRERRDAP